MRNRAICADLDEDEIAILNQIGRRQTLRAGQQLMWEGDEAVVVANVVQGVLKLSSYTTDGREQILGLAYPSDFLGRPFGPTSPYGVEALTETLVCVFHQADFERFARTHPRLEHKLLERTLTELDRSRRWMLLLGRMSAEQRLAAFLLEMSERLSPATCAWEPGFSDSLELPLSRQQIADVLGLTIETVSRQFTRMKAKGLIDLPSRRGVRIVHREGLEARTV